MTRQFEEKLSLRETDTKEVMMGVEALYVSGYFERGCSKKVDEAICVVLACLFFQADDEESFQSAWGKLLEAITAEFPNVSAHNLCTLSALLIESKLYQQNLVICRFVVELLPNSAEDQCLLGQAYYVADEHELAVRCYKRAYELTADDQGAIQGENRIRACKYLVFLAKTKLNLGHRIDALIHATRALGMLEDAMTPEHAKVYKTLMRIHRALGNEDLAGCYQKKMQEAEGITT